MISRVLYLSLLLSNFGRTQNYTLTHNFSFRAQNLLQGCLAQKSGISVQVLSLKMCVYLLRTCWELGENLERTWRETFWLIFKLAQCVTKKHRRISPAFHCVTRKQRNILIDISVCHKKTSTLWAYITLCHEKTKKQTILISPEFQCVTRKQLI